MVEGARSEHRGQGGHVDPDREALEVPVGEHDEHDAGDDGGEERVLVEDAAKPRDKWRVHPGIVPTHALLSIATVRPWTQTQSRSASWAASIEKQRTTPDAYPLSVNSLRLACNQATNRDPVVDYDESTIRVALERLSRRGWVRLTSGAGSQGGEVQTPLRRGTWPSPARSSRCSRCSCCAARRPWASSSSEPSACIRFRVARGSGRQCSRDLVERDLVVHLKRRPGRRRRRYAQLLGAGLRRRRLASAPPPARSTDVPARIASQRSRIALSSLEQELATLEDDARRVRSSGHASRVNPAGGSTPAECAPREPRRAPRGRAPARRGRARPGRTRERSRARPRTRVSPRVMR